MYLSCCQGATSDAGAALVEDDFLGLADAIIHAGVPSVLGYRWPLSDVSAPKFTTAFYTALAEREELDTAVLEARKAAATASRDDPTWYSPILIMQD